MLMCTDSAMPSYRLTSILISRFLINLQAADQKSTGMASSTGSRVDSVIFERVVGSLGGHTDFGDDTDFDGLQDNEFVVVDDNTGDE